MNFNRFRFSNWSELYSLVLFVLFVEMVLLYLLGLIYGGL